jgi:hypothetical protein
VLLGQIKRGASAVGGHSSYNEALLPSDHLFIELKEN